IIYETEAKQWATYLQSLFTGSISEAGICCYDIATVSSRRDDFLRLSRYTCKLLILSKGMLESFCPMRRFFLARVLSPAAHVVVLLCGVDSLTPLLELVPLNGDECLQISSEQDAAEYLSTVTDIVRKGRDPSCTLFWRFTDVTCRITLSHFVYSQSTSTTLQSTVPSVWQSSAEVFILLRNEAAASNAEVEFSGENQMLRLKPVRWNERILCVSAPDFPAGNVKVTVFSGGVALKSTQLQYYSSMEEITCLLLRVADPVDFMCQVSSVDKLDEKLASMLLEVMPTGGFQGLQSENTPERELHHADVPSLLHFAAQYGFRSVSSLLLQCPGADRALHTANRHGQTPTEIAKSHGHTERATVAQIADEVDAGSDRKVSENSTSQFVGAMVPMLTPVHRQKCQQWARELQNWTMEQWKKMVWSDESCFLLHHVEGWVRHLPEEHMAPRCTMGRKQAVRGSQGGEDKEGEDEDLYAPLGMNDEYDTFLNSTKAVLVANRPPAPTPRPESTQVKESGTPYIAQEHCRSPLQKQTKARMEKRAVDSPQSLTVQFQQLEYFMKTKHPKVSGIIKAHKSLNSCETCIRN
uniref:DBB domain-containing protein n=1 Tax=Amphiprion ocellaris TaxID=80972 RepID=A0AAQ6A5D1_AMPOC